MDKIYEYFANMYSWFGSWFWTTAQVKTFSEENLPEWVQGTGIDTAFDAMIEMAANFQGSLNEFNELIAAQYGLDSSTVLAIEVAGTTICMGTLAWFVAKLRKPSAQNDLERAEPGATKDHLRQAQPTRTFMVNEKEVVLKVVPEKEKEYRDAPKPEKSKFTHENARALYEADRLARGIR